MKVKGFIYLLILSLLFSTNIQNLTSQETGNQVQTFAPLPSNQTPFPLVSFTLNMDYFLSFFGDIYVKLKSKEGCKTMQKDMQQWGEIMVNLDIFNKKIIYKRSNKLDYSELAKYVSMALSIPYLEFCSKNH